MGKAYRIPSATDRLRKQQIAIRNLQALNRNRNTPRPVATTATSGVSAAGDTGGGTGNFLATKGDTMIGPLALSPPVDFRIQIDSDGAIDIGESSSNSQYTSNIQLNDIQPNTFVLDTITGANFDGQIIVIRTFAPSTPFTIAQATLANGGNIQTLTDGDFTMGDLQVRSFIFDASLIIFSNTGGTWREWGGGTGGGGDITEPIELGFNEVTTQTPPTKTIVAGDIFNPSHITLDKSIELQLDISATTTKYKSIFVIFDTTGNDFTVTWPDSVPNPPIIDDSVVQRISVILYTINNGTLWTSATSVGSSSSSRFSGNLSDLTIDVTKDWSAQGISNFGNLTGVTGIDLDGASATIQGIVNLDFFQAGQSIQNKADPDGGILYNAANLQSHIFRADSDEIARFEESAASVFRLNMLDHSIRDAKDIGFDVNATFAGSGAAPTIGYDNSTSRWLFNLPSGSAGIFVTENNSLESTVIKPNSLASNFYDVEEALLFTVSTTTLTQNGQMNADGTDIFAFSGGSLRNLSNIGVAAGGANVFLSNLSSPTSINQSLLPQGGLSLGGTSNIWSAVHVNNVRLGTAGVVSATDNHILGTTTGIDFNIPTGSFKFDFLANAVEIASLSNSGTFSCQAAILDTTLHLNNVGTFTGINGDVYLEGSDVKIFSGGIERNASDIVTGGGANTALSNLTSPTAINQTLILGDNNITGIGDMSFTGSGSVVDLNGGDITGFDTLQANGTLSEIEMVGGDVNMGGGDVNMGGGDVADVTNLTITFGTIKSTSSVEFAIQLDNATATVGSGGMLAIPVVNVTAAVTVPLLDSAFGTHKGAIGLDVNTLTNSRLWVRENAVVGTGGAWLAFDYVTRLVES